MLVYRMEHADGTGFYQFWGFHNTHAVKMQNGKNHPTPEEEKLNVDMYGRDKEYNNYSRFGCSSIDQLREWFHATTISRKACSDDAEWLAWSSSEECQEMLKAQLEFDHAWMAKHELKVSVYKVPRKAYRVGKSKRQVMFDSTQAKLVNTISLDEFMLT